MAQEEEVQNHASDLQKAFDQAKELNLAAAVEEEADVLAELAEQAELVEWPQGARMWNQPPFH